MKLYLDLAEWHGLTFDDLKRGHWSLYADVKCLDCEKEYSLATVGDVGGKCPRCGGICL